MNVSANFSSMASIRTEIVHNILPSQWMVPPFEVILVECDPAVQLYVEQLFSHMIPGHLGVLSNGTIGISGRFLDVAFLLLDVASEKPDREEDQERSQCGIHRNEVKCDINAHHNHLEDRIGVRAIAQILIRPSQRNLYGAIHCLIS